MANQTNIAIYTESFVYLTAVLPDYLLRYPGKWIATFHDKVFGPAENRHDLQAVLDREGFDRKQCAITILDQRTMLL